MNMAVRPSSPTLLGAYAKCVVASVLVLIFFGALVKSNDAGLAVPDWPTSFQQGMFEYPPSKWVGNVFYEHVHRLIASGVGFLTFILALWVFFKERRRAIRYLALSALLLVIIQGILGGLTVLYLLPTYISVAHGVIAQTFMVLLIILAYNQSTEWKLREYNRSAVSMGDRSVFIHSLVFGSLVYVQLIVAALMRHTDSGLAILDFPSMGGTLIPTFDASMLAAVNEMRAEALLYPASLFQVAIHFAHRALAFVILGYAIYLAFFCASPKRVVSRKIVQTARFLFALILIQFVLGVASVWSLTQPTVTSIHVVVGALLLATAALLGLRSYPIAQPTSSFKASAFKDAVS